MKQKLSELIRQDDKTLMLRRMQEGTTYMLIIRRSIGELHKVNNGRLVGLDYITMRQAVELYQQHDWTVIDGTTDAIRETV